MTPERPIDDLMQHALDGALDEAERRELADRLSRDAAAAERFEELRRVSTVLREIPEEPAPPGVRVSVMTHVQAGNHRSRPVEPTFLQRAGTWLQALVTEGPFMKTWKMAAITGAAVVVAAGLIYFGNHFPPGDTDSAVGSIGAVKKYSAPQITDQDVVLGVTSADDTVPFSDFIIEAAALGNASDALGRMRRLDAKTYDAKKAGDELEAVGRTLDARVQAINAKLQAQAELLAKELQAAAELEAKRQLGAGRTLDAKRLEAGRTLDAKQLEAGRTLDAKRYESMALEAKSLADGLAAKQIRALDARDQLGRMARTLNAAGTLDAKRVESAVADLEAASRLAQAKSLNAAAELGRASRNFYDARQQFMQAKTLDARRQYLDAAAAHASDLAEARVQVLGMKNQLNAGATLDAKRLQAAPELAARLQAKANDLAAKGLLEAKNQLEAKTLDAKNLLGAKNQLDLGMKSLDARSELAAKDELGRMTRTLDAKILEAKNSLGAASAGDLGACNVLLGAKDMLNASTLESINNHLGAISRLGRSNAVGLEAKTLESMNQELGRATTLGAKIQAD